MQRIAYLLVPYLADYASVYILEDNQSIVNVANAHASLEKQRLLHSLHARVQLRLDTEHSLIAQVMRTGQPLLEPDFDWQQQYADAAQPMRAYLEALRPVSHIIVPLTARGRALGVMVLALTLGDRRFTRTDLGLAEEVARRAALAADNARLFQHAQRLNAELELRVQERTAELQASNVTLEHEIVEREAAQAQLQAFTNELRALTTRLELVREEERTRIAREVHDELGGALTGLKMDLTRLRRQAEAQDIAAVLNQAQVMLKLLDSTVKTVRRIATDLRPGVLDDFGLVAAIEWQLQDFQTRAGIECTFTTTLEDLPLPPEAATAVFRIFQETLTNVARHAQATRVTVDLKLDGDQVLLSVEDNGRGIAPDDVFGNKSLGLVGMRERVHLLAGQLEISGAPGQGTSVWVRMPLPQANPGDKSQAR
jgi:signal transduction histidine kinase